MTNPFRFLLAGFCLMAIPLASPAADGIPKVELKLAFPNLVVNRPMTIAEPNDGTKKLFLVDQAGRLLILPKDRSATNTEVFLDISDRKPFIGNEEGLLGLAFHPQFKTNRKFYIYYSQQNPRRSVVSEIQASATDANKADLATERVIMEIPQPYENHNGGTTIFGPDGFLYIGLGDGGSLRDPQNNGQKMSTLLGKVIRIDVNSKSGELQYGVPQDNPFVGKEGVRPEIWAVGLRNPWRMSFDRETGEFWLADVGQDKWEEINIIRKGANYGWRVREAFHVFNTNGAPAEAAFTEPVLEYPHNPALSTNHLPGLSITGGYVYRGKKNPGLKGAYVYADFAVGTIWALRQQNGKATVSASLVVHPKGMNPPKNVAGFGEDNDGEIYVLTFEGENGKIGRISEFVEQR